MYPKIVIPEHVHRKIMHWVNKSEYEVSGLGKVTVESDGTIRVLDAMLLPQKNAAAHTDIEGDVVTKAMFELRQTPGELRFWWHSHVNMDVFWSQQDKETIKECGAGGWCVATVFNKLNQMRSAFYSVDGMKYPWGSAELYHDEIPAVVEKLVPTEMKLAWDAEYDKNVTIERASWATILGGDKWPGEFEAGANGLIKPLNKKERKRLKRIQKQLAAVGCTAQVTDEPPGLPNGDLFDEDDLRIMRAKGFTTADIVKMERVEYFNAREILLFVERGWCADEIVWAEEVADTGGYDGKEIVQMLTDFSPYSEHRGAVETV